MKRLKIMFVLFLMLGFVNAQDVPSRKQTDLKLYVTAEQAFKKYQANPLHINILDVRTPQEYVFVGHAPMAVNIPLFFMEEKYNKTSNKFEMKENNSFLKNVKEKFSKTDTIFVMCRSGGRSANSCNILAENGYKNVFNIIDGFEGDVLKDENSYFNGKRVVNGWKNTAPWTYNLNEEKVYKDK
jgi:rhodanese-related sulfurtransferase